MTPAADLAHSEDAGAPNDLAAGLDSGTGGVHDAGAGLDSGADASVTHDLADAHDLAVGADLAVTHDLAVALDLSVAHDLSVSVDLSGSPDFATIPDLAGGSPYSSTNPLQVDLSSILDSDTVANEASNGQTYPPLIPMDGSGYDFMTESVAEDNFDDGAGLPSDGLFAADANHPNAQLAFNDNSTGRNSAILNSPLTSLLSTTFPIVNTQFSALQLYVTSTEGSSAASITLNYSDSTTDISNFTVPDWFQSSKAVSPVFVVQSSLSRFSLDGDDYSQGAALYGVSVVANPAKTLTSVTVRTTASSGRLVIYGATAY